MFDDFVTQPPKCIFCGTPKGPFDVEDVFPKWLRKALRKHSTGPGGNVRSSGYGISKLPEPDNVLRLVLKDAVCKPCNNVWMSKLEDRVKRTIGNALTAQGPMRLTAFQQENLARWMVQKTLLIQLAMRQAGTRDVLDFVTHEHLSWLYEHRVWRTSPPGTGAWLFVNDVVESEGVNGPRSIITSVTSAAFDVEAEPYQIGKADRFIGVLFTFCIAFLGFQILISNFSEQPGQPPTPFPPPGVSPYLAQICPMQETPKRWPQSGNIIKTPTEFMRLAHWQDPKREPDGGDADRAQRADEAVRQALRPH